jgi:Tfp pilus assembly PilM family ATPase
MASLLKAGKLNAVAVDLDMFALVNVFEANYSDFVMSPAIIVHGKEHATSIIVTQNGSFLDFEIIDHQAGLSAADSYADLINETVGQGFASLSQPSTFPIFCTGPVFGRPEFSDSVFSRLGNAQMLNPLSSIKATVSIPQDDIKQCIPFLAVAVGCAIRGVQ